MRFRECLLHLILKRKNKRLRDLGVDAHTVLILFGTPWIGLGFLRPHKRE